jgi:hypothetical protein
VKRGGNIKNLKPFKKGETGNPNGRPPKLPDIDVLLADVLGEEKDGKTAAQAILMALRAKAAKGDVRAAEVLLDRGWGKVKQPIDHSGQVIFHAPQINRPPLESGNSGEPISG